MNVTFRRKRKKKKKRENRITHVYNGTPASFLNQNTMCRVSSPGGVMSHGNSAGFPSTTLILTSGTANENRRIVRLKGVLRFRCLPASPNFDFPRIELDRLARRANGEKRSRRRTWGSRANIRPAFFDSENPDIRMRAQSNGGDDGWASDM